MAGGEIRSEREVIIVVIIIMITITLCTQTHDGRHEDTLSVSLSSNVVFADVRGKIYTPVSR